MFFFHCDIFGLAVCKFNLENDLVSDVCKSLQKFLLVTFFAAKAITLRCDSIAFMS